MNKNPRIAVMLLLILLTGCSAKTTPSEPVLQTAPQLATPGSNESTTTPPTAPRLASPSPLADTMSELDGLDIDSFFQASYQKLLLRDPELVTELGLAEELGVGHDQLTDISEAYQRETLALEAAILDQLNAYDRSTLTPAQALSADIYAWYLNDQIADQPFVYYDYPVAHFIIGVQNQLIHFFSNIHPVRNRQEAQDYIQRLSQVEIKFAQLIEGLKLREAAGVILPKFIIQWVLYDLRAMTQGGAQATPFYATFREKVKALNELDDADKQTLIEAAENEIQDTVIPAFQALIAYLEHLERTASNDVGVGKLTNGEAYYAYLLRQYTTTDLTADEIHQLGLQEVERIQGELRVLFDALGYPQHESIPQLFQRVARDGGSYQGSEVVMAYEAIIQAADRQIGEAFDLRPSAEVIVIGGPSGGYYEPPAMDGSRPGAFYASLSSTQPRFSMATLAYHETIPGHHLQIAIAQELDLPFFRNNIMFTAYTEGWALYAERLAWELGWYENDPYGNLGRLQAEAFRAARLVVDTGIHAKGWAYDQAVDYMYENTGLSRGMVEFEVSRYVVWPGQATAYKIGMLKILELRQRAMDQLGDRFDLKEFHNVVLGNGSMPLEILEQVVDDYIAAKASAGPERYQASADLVERILSVERERSFRVHIPPSYQSDRPMPLVLSFHGGLGTAAGQESTSGMSPLADQAGFIVVYPQAWSPDASQAGRWYTGIEGDNWDLAFVQDLLDHLKSRLNIDPGRVYAAGYSNGGTLIDLLGCELSDRFAAIASVSGAYADPTTACQPRRAVSVITFYGANDRAVPYEGPNWAPMWVERNGCDLTPTVVYEQAGVSGKSWGNCRDGAKVALYVVEGEGHTWFKNPLDASAVMWDFFTDHPLDRCQSRFISRGR